MRKKRELERMDVNPNDLHYREHLARYDFACRYVSPGPLLDIASGTGYGCAYLQADCKAHVVGIDIDRTSALEAHKAYPDPRITFMVGDGTAIPFQANTFKTITCLETLEHIQDDARFLSELARVLRSDGICVLSATNRLYSQKHEIRYPYHVREYDESELLQLLSSFMQPVQIFYQGFEERYHEDVRKYANEIQIQKRKLPKILRWAIDHFYQPFKQYIPVSITNHFIRNLLGLSYPQPGLTDITISTLPLVDCSTFVVICRKSVPFVALPF